MVKGNSHSAYTVCAHELAITVNRAALPESVWSALALMNRRTKATGYMQLDHLGCTGQRNSRMACVAGDLLHEDTKIAVLISPTAWRNNYAVRLRVTTLCVCWSGLASLNITEVIFLGCDLASAWCLIRKGAIRQRSDVSSGFVDLWWQLGCDIFYICDVTECNVRVSKHGA